MTILKDRIDKLMCMEADGEIGESTTEETPEVKTFTQEQVNSMIATEKRNNKTSVYKGLGFENEEEAKDFITKYRQQEENNKTELEKIQQQVATLEAEKKAESLKAQSLEYRFTAIKEGCQPDSANDVVLLAKAKMTDDKDFETALKEIKDQYPVMFKQSESSAGTGGGGTAARTPIKGGDISGIGKRLAEQKNKQNATQNEYFK